MQKLSQFLSMDDVRYDTVIAYANESGFRNFIALNLPYEIIEPPSLVLNNGLPVKKDWRAGYPSYQDYLGLMQAFKNNYPELCRLEEFGTTVENRKLLALKISDHPDETEKEPVLLYTSTMHGDEPLGFVLMLRLLDHLLVNYPTDSYIKKLVDQVEIWINPLFNPDGTYFLSDTSIFGATRFNAQNIDLNRDFPDIQYSQLTYEGRQPETVAMMHFMEKIRPVLAANFHSGAEVVNYPWDTWYNLHADDSWYRKISRDYADTAHEYGPENYMTFLDNGITQGRDWYIVHGGRQDYVNYFLYGREVTIELSEEKIPAANTFDLYWNANKKSLLQFIEQTLTGITGIVKDSLTGLPLRAQILTINHDVDNSFVLSDEHTGWFFRLNNPGMYNLYIRSPGFQSKLVPVNIVKGELTDIEVELSGDFDLKVYPNPFTNHLFVEIPFSGLDMEVVFYDLQGRKVKFIKEHIVQSGQQTIRADDLSSGLYILRINYNNQTREFFVSKTGK